MKVLLNANIEKLGRLGDLVEVKPGFARNYLLPRGLAVEPNKHNLEVMKYKKIKAQKQLELEKLSAMEQKAKLEELKLVIEKKAGETDTLFGSVTAMEIEKKLAEMGIEIERKKFQLDEPIKKLGSYVCKIRLVEDVVADLKVEVVAEGGEEEDVKKEEAAEETPAAEEALAVEETPAVEEAPVVEETAKAPETEEAEPASEAETAPEVKEDAETEKPAEEAGAE